MSHSGGLALKKSQETNSVMSEIKVGLEQTVLVSLEKGSVMYDPCGYCLLIIANYKAVRVFF